MTSQRPINYGLRKIRAIYVLASVLIIMLSGVVLLTYNHKQVCSTDVYTNTGSPVGYSDSYRREFNEQWQANNPDNVSMNCSSAAGQGNAAGLVIITLEIIVAVVGYFFLPRIHSYFTPSRSEQNTRI